MIEPKKADIVISTFLKSIKPWNKYIVIGGGYALIIYKLYLTDQKLKNMPVGTRDIDSLIPRKVPELSKKNIAKHLDEAGFEKRFIDHENPASEAYSKEIAGIEVEIEFLTDSATRNNKNRNVSVAGIVAQPLTYISLSLQKTLEFKTYSEDTGSVVSPGAWLFHKGLTFLKRKEKAKTYKDLYGIWYVTTQLGKFSSNAVDELHILAEQHKSWFKTFCKNLQNWLEHSTPTDWNKLEKQDPTGNLKKEEFRDIISYLRHESDS